MGLRIDMDVDSIIATVRAVGKDMSKEGFAALKDGAKKIRDQARDYAPVDDHDLEKAIIVQVEKEDHTVFVGIDPRKTDERGVPVSFYGMIMHEWLAIGTPGPLGGGVYGLGPKSVRKDGGRGVVGGKFLERAFNENVRKILDDARIRVKRIFR